jgi:tRNA(fMet)-specific endonuclease VapC
MKVLLDTDVCIYTINRRASGPLERLRAYEVGNVGISVITYAELRYGVENSARAEANGELLERFLLPIEILPFDTGAARFYGRVRNALKRRGHPIGGNDLLIAAHALSLDVILATNNVREFERVEGLRVERWS